MRPGVNPDHQMRFELFGSISILLDSTGHTEAGTR
jgi:hypothetical protein